MGDRHPMYESGILCFFHVRNSLRRITLHRSSPRIGSGGCHCLFEIICESRKLLSIPAGRICGDLHETGLSGIAACRCDHEAVLRLQSADAFVGKGIARCLDSRGGGS